MISIGYMSIIGMISHVVFIYITWTALHGINVEPFVRKNKLTEARIILVFIAIVIGTGVSRFVLDIVHWSQDLIYLF